MGRNIINRVGEKWTNKQGCNFKIISYINKLDVTILFEDGYIKDKVKYDNIKKGQVKNINYPSVFGIGYEGIGKYTFNNSPHIRSKWKGMLERCYCEKWHIKKPSYIGCSVDERWHNFQVFAEWFEQNYKDGFELDKDILFKGNKVYSPETCCFVPSEINILFKRKSRIDTIKVTYLANKYKNKITNDCYKSLINN